MRLDPLRKLSLGLAAVVIAATLAACGDDNNDTADASPGPDPTPVVTAQLVTLDASILEKNRQRLQDSKFADTKLKPAWDALKASADKALGVTPGSVMDKKVAAPSGDMHDYISMGPYWWPNPNTPNGLPYIRKDGVSNPEATDPTRTDKSRFGTTVSAIHDLSLAYYFTGDEKYATKAADFIRTWFLDPATKMNPNLNYGQAILGVVDGRGTGLIDTSGLWKVIDAVALIAPSGALKADEVPALKKWFGDFANWMVNSPVGHEEYVWHNNHGTFYDAQLAAYYLFNDDVKRARQVIYDAQTKRLALQVTADGKQYMELERTRPYNYSTGNLQGLMLIARYGEQVNTPDLPTSATDDSCAAFPQVRCVIDMWNFEVDGRNMRKAVDYMTRVTLDNNPAAWEFKGSEESKYARDKMVSILAMAERAWGTGTYAAALDTFIDKDSASAKSLDRLLWSTQ